MGQCLEKNLMGKNHKMFLFFTILMLEREWKREPFFLIIVLDDLYIWS